MPWSLLLRGALAAVPVERIVAYLFSLLLDRLTQKTSDADHVSKLCKSAGKIGEAAEAFGRAAQTLGQAAADGKVSAEEAARISLDLMAIKAWAAGEQTPAAFDAAQK